jgi:hypothetical protein
MTPIVGLFATTRVANLASLSVSLSLGAAILVSTSLKRWGDTFLVLALPPAFVLDESDGTAKAL